MGCLSMNFPIKRGTARALPVMREFALYGVSACMCMCCGGVCVYVYVCFAHERLSYRYVRVVVNVLVV